MSSGKGSSQYLAGKRKQRKVITSIEIRKMMKCSIFKIQAELDDGIEMRLKKLHIPIT